MSAQGLEARVLASLYHQGFRSPETDDMQHYEWAVWHHPPCVSTLCLPEVVHVTRSSDLLPLCLHSANDQKLEETRAFTSYLCNMQLITRFHGCAYPRVYTGQREFGPQKPII